MTCLNRSFSVFLACGALVLAGCQSPRPDAKAEVKNEVKPADAGPRALAAWSFAQADGELVPDATGHGYDARIRGGVNLVARGAKAKAQEFDGSGDNGFWNGEAQNCGMSIAKPMTRGFTQLSVEAWLRKEPAGWMAVLYRDMWDDESGFGLYAEWSAGKVVFGHYGGNGVQSEAVVQDGQWHHVVGTMQPADGNRYTYRIYVDGRLDAEDTGDWGVIPAPTGKGVLMIGYPNRSGADHPFTGALDDLAIYDVALTADQVKARFEATRPRP